MKKSCKQCNIEFDGRPNAYYCGRKCRVIAFRSSLETVSQTVSKLSETETLETVSETVSDKPKGWTNNWERLRDRFPKKIKDKTDALRYAAHCILQSVPNAVLIVGNSVYGNEGTSLELDQPEMGNFE